MSPAFIAINRTVKTAIGLRRQLFSPSPREKKGRRSKPTINQHRANQ